MVACLSRFTSPIVPVLHIISNKTVKFLFGIEKEVMLYRLSLHGTLYFGFLETLFLAQITNVDQPL